MHADISRGQYVDPRAGRLTFKAYADQWRQTLLHRPNTAERTERVIRRHLVPVLGDLPIAQIRSSHIRGWVRDRAVNLAPSTVTVVYFGTLVPLFNAAVADKRIGASPCVGIRLPEIEDGKYYIARPEEVHALHDALPERYRPIVYLAAGEVARFSVWSATRSTSTRWRSRYATSSRWCPVARPSWPLRRRRPVAG